MSTQIEYPVGSDLSKSPLPFSPAVKVGNLLFVSGQASTDEQGNILSDEFEAEFRRSIENVRKILRAAGTDLDRVVQLPWEERRRLVQSERFQWALLPAMTLIVMGMLVPTRRRRD